MLNLGSNSGLLSLLPLSLTSRALNSLLLPRQVSMWSMYVMSGGDALLLIWLIDTEGADRLT